MATSALAYAKTCDPAHQSDAALTNIAGYSQLADAIYVWEEPVPPLIPVEVIIYWLLEGDDPLDPPLPPSDPKRTNFKAVGELPSNCFMH